ncbi:unnamed protein product [Vitrella brassicaformis CCMP3155]|uniref:AP2/ERF domain-containing protein n=1 Tax=Vitrella brassicaformis (strain CCMP3155) TaxID=1169540 RepID=A0A0G4G064_VITBC|nr:unnamed protein product [Vitrella brassicaformis CCMP3155]|eukprot:CEM21230.1 unnamed protein product [Vitrella brassicaformis CCMP3155]
MAFWPAAAHHPLALPGRGTAPLYSKPFPVGKFGYQETKHAATAHRRAMDVVVSPWPSPGGGIAAYRPIDIVSPPATASTRPMSEHQSGVRGVSFNKCKNSWTATWCVNRIPYRTKKFSVRKYGYEGAKKAAIAHRREMERLKHYFDGQCGSLMAIPPAERHRQGAVDHRSGPQEETDTTDGCAGPHETRAGGQPAATSAADMDGSSRVEEDVMLTKLLEGVRATDPESGGRYEIATVTAAGRQTKAVRWRPSEVCVASDRRDVQDQGLADPSKRRMPSSAPVDPCNGRDPSPDGSRPPKRRRTEPPQNDSHHEGRPMGQTNKTVVTKHTSDIPGVCWCASTRSWVASWVEKGDKRRKHKFFSARSYGFDKAKALAEQHRREMEDHTKGTVITKSDHQSDVARVRWHEDKQAWRASWYEKGDPKKKEKDFCVKDHGFDRAKALAEEHRRELERTGRVVVRKRSEHQSGVKGVSYHKGKNSWVANWYEGGKQKLKPFSVRQLGMEGAKKAAIAHRREMERQHYTFKDRGEAGLSSPRDDQATLSSRNALAESSTASPADLSFSLYPELMAKAVSACQTTAPLPSTSATQTAAASPRVAIAP